MFYKGLKDNVKNELMQGGNYLLMDLNKLQSLAMQVNNALYKRSMEKRYIGQYCKCTSYVPFSRTREQYCNSNAIKIDNIEKRPKKGR